MKQLTRYETNIIKSYAEEFGCTPDAVKTYLQEMHDEGIVRLDLGSFQAWEYAWEQLPSMRDRLKNA